MLVQEHVGLPIRRDPANRNAGVTELPISHPAGPDVARVLSWTCFRGASRLDVRSLESSAPEWHTVNDYPKRYDRRRVRQEKPASDKGLHLRPDCTYGET